MTDYPELYRRLAEEIIKHEGKISGDAKAFVAKLAEQLQASGQQITPEIQTELTSYLTAMQGAINTGIVNAATIAAATLPETLQSTTVAKLAEEAYTASWPDGLKLSDRLWNWEDLARTGLTDVLKKAVKHGASVNKTVYDMQRTIERASAGQRFKIVETYKDDWVKELHKYAVDLIHDPSAKAAWDATVSDVEERISTLSANGSRSAAERVFSQIKQAVTKGNEALADKAVKWWLYDKQLYSLKRIARTEMSTAMHRAVIASVEGDNSIIGFQWRLSASHPIADICDYYANIEMGLGKGVFTKEAVPHHKAHPHCMCLLIPRVTPIKQKGSKNYAEFVKNSPPERQATLLPKWAQQAMTNGTPLDKLLKPDGFGLITKLSAAKSGMIDSDWKALGLPSSKALRALPNMHESAPIKISGALSAPDALSVLRNELGLKAGQQKIVKTPTGDAVIDDAWLPHVVEKREAARERYAKWILPTLQNPTEVWQAPHGDSEIRKRYLKLFADGKDDMLVVVNVTKDETVWNVIPMPTRSLDNQRQGRLLWQGYRWEKG